MYKRQGGVLITTLVTQIFLIVAYFNSATYQVIYALSTSAIMVPYALSAFYCLKLTWRGEGEHGNKKIGPLIYSFLGSLYGIWMLYASDVRHLLVSALLYVPGTILYVIARRENGGKIFPTFTDKAAFVLLILLAVLSVYAIT